VGAMDVGIGVGTMILSDMTTATPGDTLWPQLFGVAGATIGSLGVMLGTPEAQPIAIGALSGATIGLAAGSVLRPRLGQASMRLPVLETVDPPGEWMVLAVPAVQEDGAVGVALSVVGVGL